MRNLLASLYISLVVLLGMIIPAYSYTAVLPACCAQLQINTISIQNECCCCRTIPVDQNRHFIQPLTSNNNDSGKADTAQAPALHNDFHQSQSISTFSRSKSAKLKQRKLFILYGSLLM